MRKVRNTCGRGSQALLTAEHGIPAMLRQGEERSAHSQGAGWDIISDRNADSTPITSKTLTESFL